MTSRLRLLWGLAAAGLVVMAVWATPVSATFPGTNGRIVFRAFSLTTQSGIVAMNSDGTGQQQLTFGTTLRADSSPAGSPDGTRIAFSRCVLTSPNTCDIYLMNADGTNLVNLTNGPASTQGAQNHDPAWSPDGTRIVFSHGPNFDVGSSCQSCLYTINVDGTGLTMVTDSSAPITDYEPTWSPDGTTIVFKRTDETGTEANGLLALTLSTGAVSFLAAGSEASWSPDGTRIAFRSVVTGQSEIWVMSADGTGTIQLTGDVSGPYREHPSWSPDGTKIAYVSDGEIWVMDADGSAQGQVTNSGGLSDEPNWISGGAATGGGGGGGTGVSITSVGTGVTVVPTPGVSVTYSQVTGAGNTSVTSASATDPTLRLFRAYGGGYTLPFAGVNCCAGFHATFDVAAKAMSSLPQDGYVGHVSVHIGRLFLTFDSPAVNANLTASRAADGTVTIRGTGTFDVQIPTPALAGEIAIYDSLATLVLSGQNFIPLPSGNHGITITDCTFVATVVDGSVNGTPDAFGIQVFGAGGTLLNLPLTALPPEQGDLGETFFPLPQQFQLSGAPVIYDISTTAGFLGPVTVCLPYDPTGLTTQEQSALKLFHEEQGAMVDRTSAVNLVAHQVCGVVTGFSRFAVAHFFNRPPVADAGPDTIVSAGRSCTAPVTLDGRQSFDPDGGPLTFNWTAPFGTVAGATLRARLPLGRSRFSLAVRDPFGATGTAGVNVTVRDTTPPDIERVTSYPERLWPPNDQMFPVKVSVDVSDACDRRTTCRIVSVSSNDVDEGHGHDHRAYDWKITGPLTVELRSERLSKDTYRDRRYKEHDLHYTVTVECRDAAGNTTTRHVVVPVEHDHR